MNKFDHPKFNFILLFSTLVIMFLLTQNNYINALAQTTMKNEIKSNVFPGSNVNKISFNMVSKDNVSPKEDINLVAVGDWSCDKEAKTTTDDIINTNPELVIALGDLSYSKTGNCWLDMVHPLTNKLKIAFGNHDVAEGNPQALAIQYQKFFGLQSTFYSFNQGSIHFLIMNSEFPFDTNSKQYSFVTSDLSKAASDGNNKWIVVAFHSPMYTSKSHHLALTDLREIYHPLFDKYGVDLVLQGHNHNYQRSFPLEFNSKNPDSPIISDSNINTYHNPNGEIYVIAGTAGKELYPLINKESFISNQFEGYGFLEIKVSKDLTKLHGIFHSTGDDKIVDEFFIQKDQNLYTPTNINAKKTIASG